MTDKISNNNNVTWFNGYVGRQDREKLHGHKGAVIWFTGLSASGKSTIAHMAEKELHRRGASTYVFDGTTCVTAFVQILGLVITTGWKMSAA